MNPQIAISIALMASLVGGGGSLFGQDRGARPDTPGIRRPISADNRLAPSGPQATPRIARAEPVSAADRARSSPDVSRNADSADDTGPASGASLPNTMDGLNDKRSLAIGDKLSFTIIEDETNPKTIAVTDSGEVEVPYINRVSVGKKTCKQLAYHIKRLLEKEYYYQATVLIGLDSAGTSSQALSKGRIYVQGQVRSPGAQEIPTNETYTVSKAILAAGGFGPYANKRKVKLVRHGNGGVENKPEIIDLVKILEQGKWDMDREVGPGDLITVPERWINIGSN